MRKFLPFVLCCFYAFCSSLTAADIRGFWKSINDKSGKAECVLGIYDYKGKLYGRIIGTYSDAGEMTDHIYAPREHATSVPGSPFYSGLDILWDLTPNGGKFKGKIMDPEDGTVYSAKLWMEKTNLIVRGEFLIFGKSRVWQPATDRDFPKDFKKPDLMGMVPLVLK